MLPFGSDDNSIGVFSNYKTSLAAAGPTDTVRLTANETLNTNKVVNAIFFAGTTTNNSITITQNTANNVFTLGVTSGAILSMGNNTLTISGGTALDASASTTITNTYPESWNGNFAFIGSNQLTTGPGAITMAGTTTVTVLGSTLTIGGVISNTHTPGLTAAGPGGPALTGVNAYTGNTTIEPGSTINIGNGGATGASFLLRQTVDPSFQLEAAGRTTNIARGS